MGKIDFPIVLKLKKGEHQMNRAKMSYRNKLFLAPKIILTSFLLFFLFLLTNNTNAQEKKSNERQWKSVGGEKVASGTHDFNNGWYSAWRWGTAPKGMHWKNDEDREKAATHTIEEVTKDVLVKMGQITVRGPGFLAKYQRRIKSIEVAATLKFPESGKDFWTASLGGQDYLYYFNKAGEKAWKWVDRNIVDFEPSKVPSHTIGWVPVDRTMTLDVWAINPWSQGDIWWTGWFAPKGVEYEFWFFPREGGKIIKVIKYGPNGEEIDVTPTQFDEPPPGKIMGSIDDPDIDINTQITGTDPGTAGNEPNTNKTDEFKGDFYIYQYSGDVVNVEINGKTMGIAYAPNRVKTGHMRIDQGNTIITGKDSYVILKVVGMPGEMKIYPNSKVKIEATDVYLAANNTTQKILDHLAKEKAEKNKKVEWKNATILQKGVMIVSFTSVIIKGILFGFHEKDSNGFYYGQLRSVGVRGTKFKLVHNDLKCETTITVAEGEVVAACGSGDNILTIASGQKIVIDKDCQTDLSYANVNEIGEILKVGVNIDPIKKKLVVSPTADSHVYAYSYRNWNKSNWGKYENIGAGWNPTGGEKRAFLKFDLAGIDPNSVNKATLKLYHSHTGGGNAVELGVYRVMSPWQEGSGTYHSGQTEKTASYGEISWDNQPSVDRYPVVTFNPGQGVNKWVEVDVTSLIKAWLTGVPNHGMAIKVVENYLGKSESQYGFRSREFEEIDKRPVLLLSGSGGL
ncbi:MAG: DNRLRE domain-containing protein [Candidatus Aminicenantes bacterium]|nr:DNRLRE domain-containing protein [Candidatus Aminicenantes bacterium]